MNDGSSPVAATDIMVGVATRGTLDWNHVLRMQEIRDANPKLAPVVIVPGNLSVAQTLNKVSSHFMRTDKKVWAKVDDDIIPPPHFLHTAQYLVSDDNPDGYGMVCTPHPMPTNDHKGIGFGLFTKLPPEHPQWPAYYFTPPVDGLNEVDAVAMGCVVIARAVFEALGPKPFRIADDPDAPFTSDDFLFCQDMRREGFRIAYWWDGWYCDHHSTVGLAPLLAQSIEHRKAVVAGVSVE